MKKIRAIRQHDLSDCGAACLCSIARAFGVDLPLARIRELASTGKQGTNVQGLVEAAQQMGFIAKGIKGPPQALRAAPVPSIAHLQVRENFYHFVVFTKINKRSVRFMDPEEGINRKLNQEEMMKLWTGVLVILAPDAGFTMRKENPSSWRRFLDLARPFRATMLQALTGAVLFSILGLSTSLFVQKIMDFVLVNRNLNLLHLMGTAMICFLLMRMMVSWFKDIFLLKAGHQIDAGLLHGYYRHLLSLPQRFFDTRRTGEILSRMSDAIKIRAFINHSLVEICVALLIILFTLLAMACFSWQLCLLITSFLPLFLLLYSIIDSINKKVLRHLMEKTASLESHLVESVQSQRSLRTNGWSGWFLQKTSRLLTGVLKENYKAGMASIHSVHIGETLSGLLSIMLLWIGAIRVTEGHLSPGELMSFYAMLGYLLGPVKNLGNLNRTFRDALIAADRLFQILDLEQEKNAGSGLKLEHLHGEIRFHHVFFRYGSRPELFHDLNFHIPPGKITGIVGLSGCGKSSLVSLINAEYLPEQGNLMINGFDVRQIDRNSLREKIAIVPQQIEIISGTILENIAGDSDPDPGKLRRISEQIGLDRLIRNLPEGFYTLLGEHGMNLSGGERQRIALARALYRKPELLILDEATSALDAPAEKIILKNLGDLPGKGVTLVLISHKLKLVSSADHIVVIDGGRAAESGNHGELLQLSGLYKQLWSQQNPPV